MIGKINEVAFNVLVGPNKICHLRNNGIPNVGMTCYMNSFMQALLSISCLELHDLPLPFQQMRNIIFGDRAEESSVRKATLSVFDTLNEMLDNKLTLGEQQDSHEFISLFFGLEVSKPLQNYFKIVSQQNTRCQTVNCYSSTKEQNRLQIFIRPNMKIQECINACVDFKENREYKCEKCNQVEGTFSTYVIQPPRVLMLFTELFDELTNVKIRYNKSYKAFENFVKLPISCSDRDVRYKLVSFITHTGNIRNFGHYKAYTRKEKDWLCCDDNVVSSMSEPQLSDDEHVYVQFYERTENIPF